MIRDLEQPYLWGESVVCPECCAALQYQQQQQEQADLLAAQRAAVPEYLCRVEGIRVTHSHVIDREGSLPVGHIYSVEPEKGFISGYVVNLCDLTGGNYKYKFKRAQNANIFIAAIRRANPNVIITRDEVQWFIVWTF
jgi:hypothetical protein